MFRLYHFLLMKDERQMSFARNSAAQRLSGNRLT